MKYWTECNLLQVSMPVSDQRYSQKKFLNKRTIIDLKATVLTSIPHASARFIKNSGSWIRWAPDMIPSPEEKEEVKQS